MSLVRTLSGRERAPIRKSRVWLPSAAVLVALAACAHAWHWRAALVEDTALDEISGIAASRIHPDVLWTLEDGGNPASLVAIDLHGRRRAALHVAGVDNIDWEDLAGFQWQGRPHLLIADVGDNNAVRPRVRLLAVAEPQTLADDTASPVWSAELVWSDGPRDCEAVAVDVARGEILFVTKRTAPPALYIAALPARPAGIGADTPPLRAEFATQLAGVPVAPEADVRADHRAAWRHQPTAAALSPDGRTLAVLTYAEVLFYDRRGEESWAAAVARTPDIAPLPQLEQAEAITWSSDGGHVLVTGEHVPTPIYALRRPTP